MQLRINSTLKSVVCLLFVICSLAQAKDTTACTFNGDCEMGFTCQDGTCVEDPCASQKGLPECAPNGGNPTGEGSEPPAEPELPTEPEPPAEPEPPTKPPSKPPSGGFDCKSFCQNLNEGFKDGYELAPGDECTSNGKCAKNKKVNIDHGPDCCCVACDDLDYKCLCKYGTCDLAKCGAEIFLNACCPKAGIPIIAGIPIPDIEFVCELPTCGECVGCGKAGTWPITCWPPPTTIKINICVEKCRNICGIIMHEMKHWYNCFIGKNPPPPGVSTDCHGTLLHINIEELIHRQCIKLNQRTSNSICKRDCRDSHRYICLYCNEFYKNGCTDVSLGNPSDICNKYNCGTSPKCHKKGCSHKVDHGCCSHCSGGGGCCLDNDDCVAPQTCVGVTVDELGTCK